MTQPDVRVTLWPDDALPAEDELRELLQGEGFW
jgi:hypothetical protein